MRTVYNNTRNKPLTVLLGGGHYNFVNETETFNELGIRLGYWQIIAVRKSALEQ